MAGVNVKANSKVDAKNYEDKEKLNLQAHTNLLLTDVKTQQPDSYKSSL